MEYDGMLYDETTQAYINQLSNINQYLADDFEARIEEELSTEEETVGLSDEDKQKFFAMLAPILLGLYGKAMNAQDSVTYKQQVYQEFETQLNGLLDHYEKITDDASKKLQELEVEVKRLKELRASGNDLLISIHLSNGNNVKDLQELSSALLRQSLDNKIAQIQSSADYLAASNTVDQFGELLYTHKRWIWSTLPDTRHMNMDDMLVGIDEYFDVYNEQNGVMDKGLYPS